MPELITRSKLVYQWDELSEAAKQKAIEEYGDWNVEYGWWDSVYEDISEGFDGFSGKPDEFDIDRGWDIGFESLSPNREALADMLLAHYFSLRIKNRAKYKLYARAARLIKSGELEISLNRSRRGIKTDCNWYVLNYHYDALTIASDYVEEAFSDFTHQCLKQLEAEFDYLTSREAIEQCLEGYSFNEDGTLD